MQRGTDLGEIREFPSGIKSAQAESSGQMFVEKEGSMKTKVLGYVPSSFLSLCIALGASQGAPAQKSSSLQAEAQVQTSFDIIEEDHHDTSPTLRELVHLAPRAQSKAGVSAQTKPWRRTGPPIIGSAQDSVLQNSAALGPLVSASNILSFDGVSNRNGLVPSDSNASVGANQIVETVNVSYQVFSMAGSSLLGPLDISSIWFGFGGVCQSGPNFSDPVVLYDKAAGRWFIAQIASSNAFASGTECIAVSTSSDATGSFNRYAFSFATLNDYPKFGVWPDAYYASYNMFSGSSFAGAQACAYNRGAMLAGGVASAVCFQRPSSDSSLLPSDLDGTTPPPAGEPSFYLGIANSSSLNLYRFHVDFITPSSSTFTGPINIPVASFSEACGGDRTCIPQAGTTQLLDSLGDRLMFRLAYRNFGSHEALVATHSIVNVSSAAVRWYEIRSPNATPLLWQQATYAPDASYRWMGSIAMDKFGNIALGYSLSSSTLFPSIAFTGQGLGDNSGIMEAESRIITGGGGQTGFANANRWGDYSSMAVDPNDDATFIYTNQYFPTTSAGNWTTRIASFKLAENFSLAATPCSQTVTAGKSISYAATVAVSNGIRNSVALSASGLPPGAAVSFNPASLTGPGSSTIMVSTSSSTPIGNSTLTVAGTNGITTQTSTVTLTVASSGSPGTGSVTISGSEKGVCSTSCRICSKTCATWDTGGVTVTVNGFSASAGYGQTSSSFSIAQAIANIFNTSCSSPVTATVSGDTIALAARKNGTATNYSLSARSSSDDPKDFPTPSFTVTTSGPSLTGGTN
jgi:hypothetical protein